MKITSQAEGQSRGGDIKRVGPPGGFICLKKQRASHTRDRKGRERERREERIEGGEGRGGQEWPTAE